MNDRPQILAALEQQLDCYQRLAKLADVQREHVQQGDAEALIAVLQRRQGVLDELAKLTEALGAVRRDWSAFLQSLPENVKPRVEAIVAQSRDLLQQITRSDQDDVMLLQQRKIQVGKQIGQASASRQVNRAYAASAYARKPAAVDVSR